MNKHGDCAIKKPSNCMLLLETSVRDTAQAGHAEKPREQLMLGTEEIKPGQWHSTHTSVKNKY
jgi:hypothetical protein